MTESGSAAPARTGGTDEGKLFAALSWWGFLGIIFLFVKKDDPFVQHHAKQGTVLFALWVAVSVVLCVLSVVIGMIPVLGVISCVITPLIGVVGLGALAVSIIGTIKAVNLELWECPVIGEWAKKINV